MNARHRERRGCRIQIIVEDAADAARFAAVPQKEIVVAVLAQLLIEVRVEGRANLRSGGMPGHDIVFMHDVGRQIKAATKPPYIAGAQKPDVQMAGRNVRIARMQHD
jgi:hypothetical protein